MTIIPSNFGQGGVGLQKGHGSPDLASILRDFIAGAVDKVTDEWLNVAVSDVDAIVTTLATAAVARTLSGTSLNGVVGGGALSPPRNIIIVSDSHANHDAVDVVITGKDVDGNDLTETITKTDGGNTTDAGVKAFAQITSIYIPAEGGTGGTMTIGFGNAIGLSHEIRTCAGLAALQREVINGVDVTGLVSETFVDLAAADVDAIVATPVATSASPQTISGAQLDGVIGAGTISPPRNITIVSDSHVDHNAVACVVTGTDINGNVMTDTITKTDDGNATDVGAKCFATVTSIYIPAEGGTGGTMTIGTGAIVGLKAPLKVTDTIPLVLTEIDDQTAKGFDALTGTYTAPATGAPHGSYAPYSAPNGSVDFAISYEPDRGVIADATTSPPHGTYTPPLAPLGADDYFVEYERAKRYTTS